MVLLWLRVLMIVIFIVVDGLVDLVGLLLADAEILLVIGLDRVRDRRNYSDMVLVDEQLLLRNRFVDLAGIGRLVQLLYWL